MQAQSSGRGQHTDDAGRNNTTDIGTTFHRPNSLLCIVSDIVSALLCCYFNRFKSVNLFGWKVSIWSAWKADSDGSRNEGQNKGKIPKPISILIVVAWQGALKTLRDRNLPKCWESAQLLRIRSNATVWHEDADCLSKRRQSGQSRDMNDDRPVFIHLSCCNIRSSKEYQVEGEDDVQQRWDD